MFKYSLDNKRYHTFNYYLRNKFNNKVFKVPLNINSTCPNKLSGGCIYCSNNSISNISSSCNNIVKQFNDTKKVIEKKWPNSLYIAYFQSGTNTNRPVNEIKSLINKLLKIPNVVGISIATRPDCLNEEWYNYLKELNNRTYLTIELGLQSSNNTTLKYINRGHVVDSFTNSVMKLKGLNIFTVAHIINGLPTDSKADMLNTVKYLNQIGINGIKIHMLYIAKNTILAKKYTDNPFPLLTKDEYIDIVCEQLELLKSEIVIERITGDPIAEELIAPKWLLKKFVVLNDIDKEMLKRNIYQGDKTISK